MDSSAIVNYLIMYLTLRNKFPQPTNPNSFPLNFRYKGYNQTDAEHYWTWLGNAGRVAEQRFLTADLFFPFVYRGTMLTRLLLAWVWLERPFNSMCVMIPVAVTVLADWTENFVQLRELGHFVPGEPQQDSWIQVAA